MMQSQCFTFWPTNSDRELAGARAPGVTDEPGLVHGKHPVLDPGSVHPDPRGVGCSGDADGVGRALDVHSAVLDGQLVLARLLGLQV